MFSSSDPGVATVDSDGQVTALAPGGIDIFAEYAGFRTAATVIVYAPFVEIPPHDPQLVVQPGPESPFVVNRVLVKAIGDTYDGALARAIAADHGASLLAEWKNLVAFLLEYDIRTPEELYDALLALDADQRVKVYQLDYLHTSAQSPPGDPTFAARYTGLPDAWSQLKDTGPPAACTDTCRGGRQRPDSQSPGSRSTKRDIGRDRCNTHVLEHFYATRSRSLHIQKGARHIGSKRNCWEGDGRWSHWKCPSLTIHFAPL